MYNYNNCTDFLPNEAGQMFVITANASAFAFTLKVKKKNHFDLKSWVIGGTKIPFGISSNWRIFESDWLDIESQIGNLTQRFSNY